MPLAAVSLVINGDARRRVLVLADVLLPEHRMRGHEAGQKLYALLRGQIHDLDAALSKPVDPAGEVDRLTHHHLGDPELPHEPAAAFPRCLYATATTRSSSVGAAPGRVPELL